MVPRICEWCKKEFETFIETKKYCSKSCSNRACDRRRSNREGRLNNDAKQLICPVCLIEYTSTHHRQVFCSKKCNLKMERIRNKDTYRSYARSYLKTRKGDNRIFINELKSKPCMDCNNHFDPICMDFDHRDSSLKKFNISQKSHKPVSKKILLNEISKCDLVCSNCHRLRTKNRRLNKTI